jgi:hypothetical protein
MSNVLLPFGGATTAVACGYRFFFAEMFQGGGERGGRGFICWLACRLRYMGYLGATAYAREVREVWEPRAGLGSIDTYRADELVS